MKGEDMKTLVTVLAVFAFVLIFAIAPQFTLAQEKPADQSAITQDTHKRALSDDGTPQKFRSLVGKWKTTSVTYLTRINIPKVVDNGDFVGFEYFFQNGRVEGATGSAQEKDGKLLVEIRAGTVKWKLEYADSFGGMLDGAIRRPGTAFEIPDRFYRSN